MFAGFLGSILFLLILTAISNFEMIAFGKHFQSKYTEGMWQPLTRFYRTHSPFDYRMLSSGYQLDCDPLCRWSGSPSGSHYLVRTIPQLIAFVL